MYNIINGVKRTEWDGMAGNRGVCRGWGGDGGGGGERELTLKMRLNREQVPSEFFCLRTVVFGKCDTVSKRIVHMRLSGKVDDSVNPF